MGHQYYPQIYQRRSIRLKSYDYNRAGEYFVTICVQHRACLLGEITNQTLKLNEYGEIVQEIWNYLPQHFDNLEIDAVIIISNYFHGILICTESEGITPPISPPKRDHPFYEHKKTRQNYHLFQISNNKENQPKTQSNRRKILAKKLLRTHHP